LVNKTHVKRLFTNEKELQKLQEQLSIRNITWLEVTLLMGFTRQPVSLCEARAEAWIETLFVKSLVSNLLQMCQTEKTRPDLVPFNTLEAVLRKKYPSVWSSIGYIPSLPELSKNYDVPLVECVLTPKHAMIGIHVPLIHKSSKLEIRRLITPPFALDKQIYSIGLTVADLIFPTDPLHSQVRSPTGKYLLPVRTKWKIHVDYNLYEVRDE
jgi:hypothetical protein